MTLIKAFFRLIRWPNLVFIVLTQCLFYFCIIQPNLLLSHSALPGITTGIFVLMVAASVCIAAGGYIINDYFDINIDQVNKPNKMVVEKIQGIDEKISALQNLKNMLTELSCQCDGTAIIEECPILTSLQNDPIKNKRIQKVKK